MDSEIKQPVHQSNTHPTYANMDELYDILFNRPCDRELRFALQNVLDWDVSVGKYIINDLKTYQLLKLRHGF